MALACLMSKGMVQSMGAGHLQSQFNGVEKTPKLINMNGQNISIVYKHQQKTGCNDV